MARRLSIVVGVIGVLTACEPERPIGACGGEVCTSEQRCDPGTLRCVRDEAPIVTISPIAAVATAATFTVSGTARDDVELKSATWSFGGGGFEPLPLDADGGFTLSVPAPLVDEQAFVLVVRASDGRQEDTESIEVRVDRVGPRVELVAPVTGDAIGGASAQVTARASDGSETLGAVTVNGVAVASATNAAAFSAPVTVPAGSSRVAFPVQVRAADVHGNVTTETFQVLGDSVAPALTVTSPAADDQVVTSSVLRVEGTVVDPSGPITVRVSELDGGTQTAVLDGGAWFAELQVPEVEATQTLSIVAADRFGQSTSVSRRVRLDRIGPQVTITGPSADSLHRAAFTVTATTSADATSVEAQLGSGTAVTLSGGPTSWTGQVSVPSQDYGALSLVVTARDANGSPTQAQVSVVIDSVAPVIAFTAPAAGRKFNIADFASSSDVTVSFGVTDGDPQAPMVTVNGAPSTATQLLVTTSASDNGRVVETTVVATDRAGNSATATRSFSVDRVRPTVSSWTPSANARNVAATTTVITFSEPVFGPTTATDALTLTPTVSGSSWDAAHRVWTSGALTPYTVYLAQLGGGALADDHGNAILNGASQRFSTAAFAPVGDVLLRSGVTDFTAAADRDGIVSIAMKTASGFSHEALSPQTMTLGPVLTSTSGNATVFSVNAWSFADGTTLAPRPVVGSYRYVPCTASPCVNQPFGVRFESGASTFTSLGGAFVLSQGPLANETNTAETASINGTSYVRGTAAAITLPFAPQPIVAQSTSSWVAFLPEAGQLRRVRFSCGRFTTTTCGPNENAPALANGTPSAVRVAMNLDGTCLAMAWSDINGRRASFVQQTPFCQYPSGDPGCNLNDTPAQSARPSGYSVAPWSAGGAVGLLAAWQDGSVIRLARSNPGTCDPDAFTQVGQVTVTPAAFLPIQVGQRAGLLYRTSTNDLRLFIP